MRLGLLSVIFAYPAIILAAPNKEILYPINVEPDKASPYENLGCVTSGGPDEGKPCVFPFKIDNVTYTGCTTAGQETHGCLGDEESAQMPRCSTKVDDKGNHVGYDHWGFCGEQCPVHEPQLDGVCGKCATQKGALCILDGEESEASHYYCVCAAGFVGDPHKECKPKIVKEACEKCGFKAECCKEEEGSTTYSCHCPEYKTGDPYKECVSELSSFSSSQSSGWFGR